MQVPYLSKWQREIDALRAIALNCDLTEETKWGKPCFTAFGKNVAILIPLKESCALSFFQGALLKDPARILQKIGEHTQAARWIKFKSVREITALKSSLKNYLYEAAALAESGKKVKRAGPSTLVLPNELQAMLKADAILKAAFEQLTPGRRKSYALHIAAAQQAKTRQARTEKCIPTILAGRGFNERPR
ncbi:MAG: YdeI/OmpD-associated family protein [Terracidiphilus sp.]